MSIPKVSTSGVSGGGGSSLNHIVVKLDSSNSHGGFVPPPSPFLSQCSKIAEESRSCSETDDEDGEADDEDNEEDRRGKEANDGGEGIARERREEREHDDDGEEEEEEEDKEASDDEDEEEKFGTLEVPQLSARRGSRGSLFGMVTKAPSSSGPSRSFSFNSSRDRLRVQEPKMVPPKSPPMPMRRPKSPQICPPNSNTLSAGSALHRRSLGVADSKLVVLGAPSVGKSAIVVRLLTGRFIWEYDPTLEAVYRYHTTVDEDQTSMDILDTAGVMEGKVNEGHVRWGDGFLIVYSLSDRNSFQAVPDIHSSIASVKHTPNFPCVIIANKADLVHLAEVCDEEATSQASDLGISFFRTSACEGSPSLWEAFAEVHRDVVRRARTRRRRSSAKVVIEGFYKMFTR